MKYAVTTQRNGEVTVSTTSSEPGIYPQCPHGLAMIVIEAFRPLSPMEAKELAKGVNGPRYLCPICPHSEEERRQAALQ